jgi:hypothetical protein
MTPDGSTSAVQFFSGCRIDSRLCVVVVLDPIHMLAQPTLLFWRECLDDPQDSLQVVLAVYRLDRYFAAEAISAL